MSGPIYITMKSVISKPFVKSLHLQPLAPFPTPLKRKYFSRICFLNSLFTLFKFIQLSQNVNFDNILCRVKGNFEDSSNTLEKMRF